MRNFCLLVLCGFVAGTFLARVERAQGIEAFKKEFEAKYVNKQATSGPEKDFAASVAKVKCNTCHVGTMKKMRNEYGKALGKLLDKKTDAKNVAKIQESLDKVAEMKSDPNDPSSPTFGELIKQGKLPGGDAPAPAPAAAP